MTHNREERTTAKDGRSHGTGQRAALMLDAYERGDMPAKTLKRFADKHADVAAEVEARGLTFTSGPFDSPASGNATPANSTPADVPPIPVLPPNPVDAGPTVTVTRAEPVYRPDGPHSLFRDMAIVSMSRHGIDQAIAEGRVPVTDRGLPHFIDGSVAEVEARIHRHGREMRDVTAAGDGAGFQIPYYFGTAVDLAARGTTKTFDVTTRRPMPEYGQEIDVPRTTTGVTAAVYEENAAITETDIASTTTQSPVVTLAAEVEVSWQLLERSRGLVDQVGATDATAALGATLDVQLLTGSGSNGEMTGLLSQSGITESTWTDANPTVAEFRTEAYALQRDVIVASGREPDVMIWHPTRAAWSWSGTDASVTRQTVAQDFPATGVMMTAVPTALGSGTNEDRLILLHRESVYLYASPVKYQVFTDPLSANGTVRLQARMYAALAVRTPSAVGVLRGTGMVTPSI
jgi:hypothetical protein